ncbi:flavodoxin [Lachnospira multipara]|uniref:Flavodoxin n=1 Tax=Lachnospira multipara TaxID=28051 RepID=A0A1H5TDT7_9FIRM|nr:flavodoxin [Lachnospira multipara]SEF61022.1 Flavodoxin [Lachnospira multipara]
MKKYLSLGIVIAMIVGTLAGCGSNARKTDTQATGVSAKDQTATIETGALGTTDDSEKKVLVAYYSASGNTAQVADYIAEETAADTFELVPEDIYTDADLNWTNRNSRVSREHDDESLRGVSLVNATPDNWDDYDVVFVGYPIWWGIAAWPVNDFITSNDFSGKTVIPFCTSSSSGLGQSGELLEEMAGSGTWQEGMRFRSGVSKGDVTNWVKGLKF